MVVENWKLVAVDLDGTTVAPGRGFSPRTLRALAACARAGIPTLLVTGRPLRWVTPLARVAPVHRQVICVNGALVADVVTSRVTRCHPLPHDVARCAVSRIRRELPGAVFAVEAVSGFRREPGYPVWYDSGREERVGPVEQLLRHGIPLKLVAKCPGVPSDELRAIVRRAIGGAAHITHSSVADSLVEIMAAGVNKGDVLSTVVADLGLDARSVIAFGDMPNDIEMLTWAGRSYAVADAHPEAIAAADAVAPPCHADGVAQVLERLLNLTSRTYA